MFISVYENISFLNMNAGTELTYNSLIVLGPLCWGLARKLSAFYPPFIHQQVGTHQDESKYRSLREKSMQLLSHKSARAWCLIKPGWLSLGQFIQVACYIKFAQQTRKYYLYASPHPIFPPPSLNHEHVYTTRLVDNLE